MYYYVTFIFDKIANQLLIIYCFCYYCNCYSRCGIGICFIYLYSFLFFILFHCQILCQHVFLLLWITRTPHLSNKESPQALRTRTAACLRPHKTTAHEEKVRTSRRIFSLLPRPSGTVFFSLARGEQEKLKGSSLPLSLQEKPKLRKRKRTKHGDFFFIDCCQDYATLLCVCFCFILSKKCLFLFVSSKMS